MFNRIRSQNAKNSWRDSTPEDVTGHHRIYEWSQSSMVSTWKVKQLTLNKKNWQGCIWLGPNVKTWSGSYLDEHFAKWYRALSSVKIHHGSAITPLWLRKVTDRLIVADDMFMYSMYSVLPCFTLRLKPQSAVAKKVLESRPPKAPNRSGKVQAQRDLVNLELRPRNLHGCKAFLVLLTSKKERNTKEL